MSEVKTKRMPRPKVLVILGPTASGKSTLAVQLAKKFDGEVISADSRQVYRGLDIGTGKITKREMQGIPHHLLDVANPRRPYSAGQFKKDAGETLRYIEESGRLPIICGGTGFYIDALLGTISLPAVPPNLKLRVKLKKKSSQELFAMLKKLDTRRAREIDQHNPVRLVRAIEIAKALGKVPKERHVNPYDTLKIGIKISGRALKKKIHTRLLGRIRNGMIAEARRLHARGLSWKRMESLGLEYRYLAYYLQGKMSKKEMVVALEREIGKYAKRQMRWFKRDTTIHWITKKEQATRLAKKFISS